MATTASTFTLHPPAEDSMELSSPAHKAVDGDIDIDFDDLDAEMGDGAGDHSVENIDMMEDDGQIDSTTKPSYAHDEDLIDYSDDEPIMAAPTVHTPSALALKPDDAAPKPVPSQDAEDLIDYSDDEDNFVSNEHQVQDDPNVDAPELQGSQPALEHGHIAVEELTEAHNEAEHHEQDQDGLDEQGQEHVDDKIADAATLHQEYDEGVQDYAEDQEHNDEYDGADNENNEDAHDNDEKASLLTSTLDIKGVASIQPSPAGAKPDTVQEGIDEDREGETYGDDEAASHDPEWDEEHADQADTHALALHTTTSANEVDGPATPTDTGLHPCIVYFDDHVYHLFESKATQEGLLQDDNLVSVSLADLIKAIRQSLTIATDQHFADTHELVLAFDDLSLLIVEDSKASFASSLKDVLDVYVRLHENDGIYPEDIAPLSITCSLQIKFSSSIAILQDAAANGSGMAALISDAQVEYYEEAEADEQSEYVGEEVYQEAEADEAGEGQNLEHEAVENGEEWEEDYVGGDEEGLANEHEDQVFDHDTNYAEHEVDTADFDHDQTDKDTINDTVGEGNESHEQNDSKLEGGSPHTAAADVEHQGYAAITNDSDHQQEADNLYDYTDNEDAVETDEHAVEAAITQNTKPNVSDRADSVKADPSNATAPAQSDKEASTAVPDDEIDWDDDIPIETSVEKTKNGTSTTKLSSTPSKRTVHDAGLGSQAASYTKKLRAT